MKMAMDSDQEWDGLESDNLPCGMGLDFTQLWTETMRPALTSGAAAAVATGVQKLTQVEPIKEQMREVAIQQAAVGVTRYINWIKDNPVRFGLYAAGGIAFISLSTIAAYKLLLRK